MPNIDQTPVSMKDYFSALSQLKSDPIYGLQESFASDTRKDKINLSIGVLTTESGKLHRFQATMDACKQIMPLSFGYVPISGNHATAKLIAQEIFAAENDSSIAICQSVGGTGALSLLMHLAKETSQIQNVAYLNPTWPNHLNIIREVGLNSLPLENLEIETIQKLNSNTLLLLQPCCNNPTGKVLTEQHWESLIQMLKEKNILVLFDIAYWGLGRSLSKDLFAINFARKKGLDFLVAFSASKAMSLYNCRTGWAMAHIPKHASLVQSHMEAYARATYSSPPALGSAIIHTILSDPKLKLSWMDELDAVRNRIVETRKKFSARLSNSGYPNEIGDGEGLFTKLSLSEQTVIQLREQNGLYIGLDGRINIAAITDDSIELLVKTLLEVL